MFNEKVMATIDLFIVLTMCFTFIYVYKTHKTTIPSVTLAILAAIAASTTIHIKGVGNIFWIYPSIVAIYYLIEHRWATAIASVMIVSVIPVLVIGLSTIILIEVAATIFLTSCFAFVFSKGTREQNLALEKFAIKDPLTGVGNRRALKNKLEEVVAINKRTNMPVSLIMLDIDNFKLINDVYGHSVGDDVLVKISSIIESRIRATDTLYRYGGEEFIIIAIDLNIEISAKIAEDMRTLVERSILIPNKPITISLGVAEFLQSESIEQWIKRADTALYVAKRAGRNRVHAADQTT
jgi:diguanylate cyclase (GGDEF)-like protein